MDANTLKEAASKAIQSVDLNKLKPGFKTSEFALVAATAVATFAAAAFGIQVDPMVLVSLYTLVAGYVAKRWDLKRREANAKAAASAS